MRTLLKALLVMVVAGMGWLLLSREDAPAGARGPMSVPITVWNVAPQQFQSRVNALGTLRAWESVVVTSSVSETVASLHFEDGEYAERGKLLVTLLQDEELANLREQQEFLREQEREVERLENLVRSNQVAQTDLDQRRTLAAIARNRIEQERARIADRTITAPFSGVLGLRQVSVGALVAPGDQITTLDDVSRMRLDFTVPAQFVGFLRPGQDIEAVTPAYEEPFEGVIAAVDSRVDPINRSITARATIENSEGKLKPGMLMTVLVLGATRETLLVPEESLISRAAEHFVWVVDGDNAERRGVVVGDRRPGWVEITAGLAEGEIIVRDGVARLRGKSSAVTVVES